MVENKIIKSYSFPTSTIEFWENGLVYIEIQPNTEIDLETSTLHYQTLKDNYTEGKYYYV